VRERIRREFSHRNMIGFDTPAGTDGVSTLGELLPAEDDTADAVDRREMERLADQEVVHAFSLIARRGKIALLARELGLSLAHPSVEEAAQCGKSMLCLAYNETLSQLAAFVRERFTNEDNAALARLTILIFDRVKRLILSWGRSENAAAHLFKMLEKAPGAEGIPDHEISQ